ncbi:MAG: T9SS type A sorting domain-containing protein [Ferruginibacter sp.]
MKKTIGLLLTAFLICSFAFAQNETFRLTNPELIKCDLIRITPPIRTLSNANAPMGPNYRTPKGIEKEDEEEDGQIKLHQVKNPNALPKGISPAVQMNYDFSQITRTAATLNLQFAGQGYTGVTPSDNNMASGPNHIIQMINNSSSSLIRIWDKVGNILVNSIVLSSITGVSGFGDPVVVYDQFADRYLISEFANVGNHIIIAISQTNDPTGSYYIYNYTTPNFPDYFKIATWGNSYIVTSNENSPALYALDRTKMLAGTPTTLAQRFTIPSYPTIGFQAATPVDMIGTAAAPAGSPALFMRMADDAWTTGIQDRLEIFSLAVDWVTPANTTLTGPLLLPTLPFSTNFCGYTTFSCIPQQGSAVRLDPLREVLMNKILYRNFGTYETIVCTHIDELDGNSHAGVRWYELRKIGANPWTIFQQGTYGLPADPLHRWMSCIGVNPDNSIGLGYNVAGPTSFPSIRFTGRKSCDPLGVMTEPEQTVIAGSAPSSSNRYGDYNGMTIDPVDGSFWMTANYNPTGQWATRIANFSITPCTGCTPASITTQPSNATTCAGNNTSYTVVAAGTAPLGYQWQVSTTGCAGAFTNITNGGVYSTATTATLNITGATAGMNGYAYKCVVTGNCAPLTVTSNCVTLTVNAATAITVQPANVTVCAPTATSFSVTASGTSLTYQWQLSTNGGGSWANLTNVAPYSNVTTTTLNISPTAASMNAYQYRCVVSSSCSPLNSAAAILTVNAAPAITGQPSSVSICAGNAANFSVTATGGGLTYQWQESTNGGGAWNNLTNVAPYSNVTTATLTINPAAVGMNTYQYRCIVTGSCPSPATSNAAILTVGTALIITSQPANQTLCAGGNTLFSVTISGVVISYQWQESTNGGGSWNNITNGGIYSNATTATLNLTGVLASMNTYQYRCVVTGACPAINSNAAILTVNTAPNITAQPANSTICATQNTTFSVTATGTAITYQWQESTTGGCAGPWVNIANGGIYSGATTATLTLTAVPTTMNTYQYRCVITGTCAPAATSGCGLLTVNTAITITTPPASTTVCAGATATFNVVAAGTSPVYQWQESTNGGGTWNNITNGGIYGGATTATLTLTAVTAGMNTYQYRCVVTGAAPCGIVNTTAGTLTVNTAPAITTHPVASTTLCVGGNTAYVVIANGTALTYQWQVSTDGGANYNNIANGGVYAGVTTATLTITGATAVMNTYKYRCVVSGTCTPSVTSNVGTLTVNTPITITNPASNTICATGTISFSITASGTLPPSPYQWQESTNGGTIWNNVVNGGVYSGATTPTLTLTGVTAGMTGNQYRCVVAGTAPCVAANSAAATLTVSPRPVVTLSAAPYTKLRPGLPVNPPVLNMVTTTITASVVPNTGSISWSWTLNGTALPAVTGNSTIVDLNHLGVYTVVATLGSCVSAPVSIIIGDSASSTLFIYPSPNNGKFTISYYSPGASSNTKTKQQINIYDSKGRRVLSKEYDVVQPYQLHEIDMRQMGGGVYYVVLREANGNKIRTGEVVIK